MPGYINTDFADVYNIMKDGKVAIMNTGFASGEHRITRAIDDAMHSPLLNTNDVRGAKKMLLQLYCSSQKQIKLEEIKELNAFMDKVGEDVEVIWGASYDDTLDDSVKITMVVTGFNVSDIPGMPDNLETPQVPFQVNDTPVVTEQDIHEAQIGQMMKGFYADPNKPEEQKAAEEEPEEPEEAMPVINLDDLDDENKRRDIEDIPTWKRRRRQP